MITPARHSHSLAVTKPQQGWLNFALDWMEVWAAETPEEHGNPCPYTEAELPWIERGTLHFSPGPALNDLLERLNDDVADMIASTTGDMGVSFATANRQVAALRTFAAKLRMRAMS